MSDRNPSDGLDAKHERRWDQRIEAIKRWVEYIEAEPPETWGPQQNAIVAAQLKAAQSVQVSAAHQQRVREIADEILEARDEHDAA